MRNRSYLQMRASSLNTNWKVYQQSTGSRNIYTILDRSNRTMVSGFYSDIIHWLDGWRDCMFYMNQKGE